MIKSGKLEYQSCLLISEREKDNQILIHGGTLFDYFFILDKNTTANQRKNAIISEYLRGLLELIDSNQESLNTQVKGTTYILNERTATKIGFEVEKTDSIQKIILLLNYPNLVASKSFVNKKISLPNLKQIKTYKSDIDTLNKNREKIEKINDQIRNIITNRI